MLVPAWNRNSGSETVAHFVVGGEILYKQAGVKYRPITPFPYASQIRYEVLAASLRDHGIQTCAIDAEVRRCGQGSTLLKINQGCFHVLSCQYSGQYGKDLYSRCHIWPVFYPHCCHCDWIPELLGIALSWTLRIGGMGHKGNR